MAPDASKDEIAREKKALIKDLVQILKLHVQRVVPPAPPPEPFQPREATTSPAFFWERGEVLATIEPHPFGPSEDNTIRYTYDEPGSVYLRLMPSAAIPPFDFTKIMNVVDRQRLAVMTRTMGYKPPNRNVYGAVAIEAQGNSSTLVGFSQIFRSGEILVISREFVPEYLGRPVVAMVNLKNLLAKGLNNYIEVARDELSIAPPYQIEIGVTGMRDVSLSLPNANAYMSETSSQIYDDGLHHRIMLKDVSAKAQYELIQEFLRRLYDLAGVTYQIPAI